MKTKICIKCEIEKPISKFYFRKDINCYRKKCKECIKKRDKEYYKKHKKERALYYQKNKESVLKKKKIFYKNNRERLLNYSINYRKNHKTQNAKYMKNKRRNDIRFRLSCNLRGKLYFTIKGYNKSLSTMFLVDCEVDYLMYHLQKQFKKGMSWDNYGKGSNGNGMKEWHIDHIKPCCQFDLSKSEEQRKCFHYSNLQPLWAKENHQKLQKDLNFIRK